MSHGFLAGIFTTLDRFGVVVDLISTSEVHVSMAIEDAGFSKKVLNRLVAELEKAGTVSSYFYPCLFSNLYFTRSPSIPTWPSSPSSATKCATWSVSPDACSPPSQMGTSTLK